MGDRKTLYERGLRKKVELAEELLKKTKALEGAVEQWNSVQVQMLLSERQDLMERIDRVDAEMLLPGKAPLPFQALPSFRGEPKGRRMGSGRLSETHCFKRQSSTGSSQRK
jgi:hypothetical protein